MGGVPRSRPEPPLADKCRNCFPGSVRPQRWARHWYGVVLDARTPAEAYAAYRLMLSCVDQPTKLWLDWRRMVGAPLAASLDAYWGLEHRTLQKRVEDADKDDKERLFGLRIMRQTQWP